MTIVMRDRLLEAAHSLGPLPVSITRLLTVASSPEFDLSEIADIVAHDMVLAGAVLRVANSAASSPSQQIHTVHEAIMRIGTVHTITASMQTAVDGVLGGELELYGIHASGLWTHASAASIAAGEIRRSAQLSLPASTATTALLHDIGKVVLARIAPHEDVGAAQSLDATGGELCEAERRRFGVDHAEMGAEVAELWSLPPAIVEGIAGHHRLIDDPLPSAICLADHIAHVACDDLSVGEAATSERAALSAAAVLGLPRERLASIAEITRRQLDDLAARADTDDW